MKITKRNMLIIFFLALALLFLVFNNNKGVGGIENEYKSETVISINIGTGENEVAYSEVTEGIANDGPASFAIDAKNNFYILDTLGQKVLVFKDYKWDSSIDISFCEYARDIIADDRFIYVLDDSNVVFSMDKESLVTKTYKLPESIHAYDVKKLFFNTAGRCALDTGDREYALEEHLIFEQIPKKITLKKNGTTMDIYKNDKKFSTILFAGDSGGINVIHEYSNENILIEVLNKGPDSASLSIEDTLRMIDKNGTQISIFRVPLEDYSNFPLKFCSVSSSSEIYMMAMKKDVLEINRIILVKK